MVDADGATEIEDLKQLERFLKSVPAPRNFQIAIGSRAAAENNNVKVRNGFAKCIAGYHIASDNYTPTISLSLAPHQRTAFRALLMKGFRYLRFFIVGIRIHVRRTTVDTVCPIESPRIVHMLLQHRTGHPMRIQTFHEGMWIFFAFVVVLVLFLFDFCCFCCFCFYCCLQLSCF